MIIDVRPYEPRNEGLWVVLLQASARAKKLESVLLKDGKRR